MNISLIVVLTVFFLISVRKIGPIRFKIWEVMAAGALLVLITGEINYKEAFEAIEWDVIIFLICMFAICEALNESGYLSHISYLIFFKAKSVDKLILFILFGMGFLSALLMNDTIAIIGTPVVLKFSRKYKLSSKLMLLTLAFSVTIGSVMSPIGNPQNLLIAVKTKMNNPFFDFIKYLFIPTIINLFVVYFLMKIFYKDEFHSMHIVHIKEKLNDVILAKISRFSLILLILSIIFKIICSLFNIDFDYKLVYIALISSMPIFLLSKKRFVIIKKIDWHTIIFFISMFILMRSFWNTGFIQNVMNIGDFDFAAPSNIFLFSITISQLISNVPFVDLYLSLLTEGGDITIKSIMALAAGSTIAGNLFILGAASNIIIIQNAEKSGETITFWEFTRIGFLLTLINIVIYFAFLYYF